MHYPVHQELQKTADDNSQNLKRLLLVIQEPARDSLLL
jgi:hypothetical protein